MNTAEIRRRLQRLLCVTALIVAAGAGNSCLAQDDDDDEPEPAAMQPQAVAVWADQNFDQWVYNGQNAATVRAKFNSLFTLHLDEIDRVCKLTEAQKKALNLAGKGDIKRFDNLVAEKKRLFNVAKSDQMKMNNFFQELQPLQQKVNSDMFDDSSIFFKTIRTKLDPTQLAAYQKVVREKNQFRYRAKVDLVVAMMDDSLGLTESQRRRFVKLIVEETKTPKKYGQYDYYLVMVQLAKVPEAKLKPIFDEAQWRLLKQSLAQMQGMDQFLRTNGYMFDDDEQAKPAAEDSLPDPFGAKAGGFQ